jgi:hypothetical protein
MTFFLGRGAEPAEVTDACQAAWQDMLEETADKFRGREVGGLPATILTVLV